MTTAKKLFSYDNCEVTGPTQESARVCGEIARCWANFIATYGHKPTHLFLGPREWDHFLLWMGELCVKDIGTCTKTSYERRYQGMKVYSTNRPGVACAICFVEPMLDSEPPRYVGETTKDVKVGEDKSSSGLPQ